MKKSMTGIAVVLMLMTTCSLAQSWPSRSIRLVVPWAAGGPPDAVGRLLGQRVGDAFKQQFVIDNRPGANSIIGTEMVARAAPDGYTYLLTTGSHIGDSTAAVPLRTAPAKSAAGGVA